MLKDNRYFPVIIKYKVKIEKNGKVKVYSDISKSFVRAFGVWLARMFNMSQTCYATDGSTYALRNGDNYSGWANYFWHNLAINFSNNSADQTLSYTDYKLNYALGNLTRSSGYPQISYSEDSTGGQIIITDKWTYTGANTNIYAMALYGNWDTAYGSYAPSLKTFMLIKDIFDPAINLETDSVITASYTIKVQV